MCLYLHGFSSDGSYYYSNPNGITYYNNGQGRATYTSPSGYRSTSSTKNNSPNFKLSL